MLQISSYLIVEELTNNEPRHLRARSLSTGDLVSLFLFEAGESTEYHRVLSKIEALTGPARAKILDRFTDAGRPVIVTRAIPDSETLGEMVVRLSSSAPNRYQKPPVMPNRIANAPLSRPVTNPIPDRRTVTARPTNSEWARVREKFFYGEHPMAKAPADFSGQDRTKLSKAFEVSARHPETSVEVDESPLDIRRQMLADRPIEVRAVTTAKLAKFEAPPSEMEIFEAKTLRIELPSSPMIAAERHLHSRASALPMSQFPSEQAGPEPMMMRSSAEPEMSGDSANLTFPTLRSDVGSSSRGSAWLYAAALGGSVTLYALMQLVAHH